MHIAYQSDAYCKFFTGNTPQSTSPQTGMVRSLILPSIHPTPYTRIPKPEARSPKPVARSPTPEARDPKSEARSPKPEAQNPKPETRNPKPHPCEQWSNASLVQALRLLVTYC